MVLEFLNQNSGALAVVFSAVVAIATVVYVFSSWKLVKETRKMRKFQTEPHISVNIQPREEWINFIDMIVENIGLGPAYNVKFEVDPDFEYEKGKVLSELGFMKNGLKYLAPAQKFRFFLTDMVEDSEEKAKKTFKINITYEDNTGKIHKDKYEIKFSELMGLRQLGEPSLYKIANNIEHIKKDFDNLSWGVSKVKVIGATKEEEKEIKQLKQEAKQLLERVNQQKKEGKE